jgi:hypothetical protein
MGSRMKSESSVLFQSNYGITPRAAARERTGHRWN